MTKWMGSIQQAGSGIRRAGRFLLLLLRLPGVDVRVGTPGTRRETTLVSSSWRKRRSARVAETITDNPLPSRPEPRPARKTDESGGDVESSGPQERV